MSNHKLLEVKHYADRIIVIDDQGRIKGHGTHQSLLVECPLYAQLWQTCVDHEESNELGYQFSM